MRAAKHCTSPKNPCPTRTPLVSARAHDQPNPPRPAPAPAPPPDFIPVTVKPRHDGWTPSRQIAFIEALAECGCVTDAARAVGIGVESAYRLRRRVDAVGFRQAWDFALDYAIRRLSDAAFSRAIHGVAVPHYYKGEVVGERRKYDEALTRFLLRYRDPVRYAKANDAMTFDQHADGPARLLSLAIDNLADQAYGVPATRPETDPAEPADDPFGWDVA